VSARKNRLMRTEKYKGSNVGILILCMAVVASAMDDWTVVSKYGNVRLHHLAITNASVSEAINLVINECIENTVKGYAPGVIINFGTDTNISERRVNIVTNNILVLDAIQILAEQAGLEFKIEDHAIILSPKKENTKRSNRLHPIANPLSRIYEE